MHKPIFALAIALMVMAPSGFAEVPKFNIVIQDHKFQPAEVKVPAGVKVLLVVENKDATPEEFESYELNREKTIAGNKTAVIFIGPLQSGHYPFFGEFNAESAQGMVVAE